MNSTAATVPAIHPWRGHVLQSEYAPETANVWAKGRVGFGDPLTVTVAIGPSLGLTAPVGEAVPFERI